MKKKHFLITLFNLKLWDTDKKRSATRTNEWLEKRFRLFETYCFPSVCQQSTKEFIWLCFFDENTPDTYKERILEYCVQIPQMRPIFFNESQMADWKNQIREIVRSLLADEEYVITTNLDNDDAIHYQMIETLQQEFERTKLLGLYTYINGLQYFPSLHLLLKMTYPHNHFLTYIEKADADFKTTIYIRHAEARKKMQNIIDIPNKPYWVEIVHSSNVNNDLRITSRIKYGMIWDALNLHKYGLNVDMSKKQIREGILLRFPLLFIRIATFKLLRKIGIRKDQD